MKENNLETSEDGWPWDSLMMLGLHVLNLNEKEFWNMTPRVFSSLINAYVKYKNPKEESKKPQQKPDLPLTTIDNSPSWW